VGFDFFIVGFGCVFFVFVLVFFFVVVFFFGECVLFGLFYLWGVCFGCEVYIVGVFRVFCVLFFWFFILEGIGWVLGVGVIVFVMFVVLDGFSGWSCLCYGL